jgi:periplasmic divalent cation tolerance protein
MKKDYVVVLTTCANQSKAEAMANALVRSRLCACVNILPGARSVFRWKGVVQTEDEVILLCKTRKGAYAELEKEIKRLHTYDVPEVISLAVDEGSAEYLDWIEDSTNSGGVKKWPKTQEK